jgi:2-haloacid dehalogenase
MKNTQEWNDSNDTFVQEGKKKDSVDWKEVDDQRTGLLPKLLAQRGLVILQEKAHTTSELLNVKEGSLWTSTQLKRLATIWRRLTPWPDTCHGLELLNKKYETTTLSNTYAELIHDLVKHGKMPFKHVFSSDMFNSYKPNPKVYLGAAEKMDVKPEESALVAAHLGDLKGAKACGFAAAIYVEREAEEKQLELLKEGIPDITVKEEEDGFVELARRLGIKH